MKKLFKFILKIIPRPILIKISIWIKPLLVWFYKGTNFTDPIDNKSFRKFLPYGYVVQRENALSPSTLSLERHRLLWLYLKQTDFFTSQKKVLHIAPEQCFYPIFKRQQNLTYVTADLNSPIADVKADICDLPFENDSFDIIFCNHVLEHIIDDSKAMSELYRVLKPKGIGIFQVPLEYDRTSTYEDFSIISPDERTKHFGQYDHVRVYGLDYFDRLRNVGFNVQEVNLSESLTSENIKKFGLINGEILPVCTK